MPIRVSCQCGQSFNAPDNLAGKRVKCPKCQQPIAIPAATAAAAPPKPPAAKAPSRPAPAAARAEANPFDDAFGNTPAAAPRDLFSEAGMNQSAAGSAPCPGCGKPLAPNAVLCINCGFHRQHGKKIGTIASGKGGGGGGHGDAVGADIMLARAAKSIEDDRLEELKTRSQGMPAWGYAAMLFGVIALAAMFMSVGIGLGFVVAAYVGYMVCGLGQLYFFIRILVHAFGKAAVQGILCFFVPFYIFYYCYLNWNEIGESCTMMLYFWMGGFVCAGVLWVGVQILLAFPPEKAEEEVRLLIQFTTMFA